MDQTKSKSNATYGPAVVVACVFAIMVFVGVLYAAKVGWGAPGSCLAADANAWGTFGDYFGGLLNPVVALAALALLAWSIHIQKATLDATREELFETRQTLAAQARSSQQLVALNAYTVLIAAEDIQIQALNKLLDKEKLAKDLGEDADGNIRTLTSIWNRKKNTRASYVASAKKILEDTSGVDTSEA
ncbi:hypothetical protein [Hydrogenophaga sp.]|uniref:hypothetical protein n=1 Tax=Hydrogenophaga sp. TaxID=1904254 RepID=UPI003F71E2B9